MIRIHSLINMHLIGMGSRFNDVANNKAEHWVSDLDRTTVTEQEVASFRRQGYVKIGLADIVGREAFARLRLAYLDADRRSFDFHTASWNNPGTAAVFRYNGLRHRYPDIAAFVTSPALGKAAAALMGVDHVRLLEEEALVKPPGGKDTGWHQDLPYMPVDGRHFLTMWLAVDDVEPDMSAMQYVPGSHRIGSLGRQIPYDAARRGELSPEILRSGGMPKHYTDLMNDTDRQAVGDLISLSVKAGEAIVHDGMLVHSAGPNRSDKVRRALGIVLIAADAQYTGLPRKEFDDLGLKPYQPFDHPDFPVLC